MVLAKAVIESQLSSRFGGDVFKLVERRFTEVIPTGIAEIDSLAGGLPRGAITEIFGSASSGRTSIMLSALAGPQLMTKSVPWSIRTTASILNLLLKRELI